MRHTTLHIPSVPPVGRFFGRRSCGCGPWRTLPTGRSPTNYVDDEHAFAFLPFGVTLNVDRLAHRKLMPGIILPMLLEDGEWRVTCPAGGFWRLRAGARGFGPQEFTQREIGQWSSQGQKSTHGGVAGFKACELCLRESPRLTVHHLVPRSRGGRFGPKAQLCSTCHRQLHALFSESTLAQGLDSLESIRANPQMAGFLKWARRQQGPASFRVKRSHQRR